MLENKKIEECEHEWRNGKDVKRCIKCNATSFTEEYIKKNHSSMWFSPKGKEETFSRPQQNDKRITIDMPEDTPGDEGGSDEVKIMCAPEKNYERDHFHTHCWEQKGDNTPACGQPLEKHEQCCLCDTPAPEKKEEWKIKFVEKFFVYKLGGKFPDHVGAEKEAVIFIQSLLEKERKIGKEEGYAEEGIKCYEHCEKTRQQERQRILYKIRERIKATENYYDLMEATHELESLESFLQDNPELK